MYILENIKSVNVFSPKLCAPLIYYYLSLEGLFIFAMFALTGVMIILSSDLALGTTFLIGLLLVLLRLLFCFYYTKSFF